MHRVLVTVELGEGGSSRDLEVPADLPAARLVAAIAAALAPPREGEDPGVYRLEVAASGRELAPGETLAGAGLWDGTRLVLRPAGDAGLRQGAAAGSAGPPEGPPEADAHTAGGPGAEASGCREVGPRGPTEADAGAIRPYPRPRRGWVVAVLGRPGVGRTTVAAGLAAALGGTGAAVAAVDAARPQPRLGYLLGAWQTSGYREALRGTPLEWCLVGTPHPGVALLPSGVAALAGEPPPEPGRVADLLAALAARYDWAVVDLPGDPAAPEAAGALQEADLVLWVVDGDPLDLTLIRERWRRLAGDRPQAAVLNRWDPGAGVTRDWVAEYLHLPVLAEIPEERSVARSVVMGIPVGRGRSGARGRAPAGGGAPPGGDPWGSLSRALLDLRQGSRGAPGPGVSVPGRERP